jgi:predicted metal-binding membrane protein
MKSILYFIQQAKSDLIKVIGGTIFGGAIGYQFNTVKETKLKKTSAVIEETLKKK